MNIFEEEMMKEIKETEPMCSLDSLREKADNVIDSKTELMKDAIDVFVEKLKKAFERILTNDNDVYDLTQIKEIIDLQHEISNLALDSTKEMMKNILKEN